MSTQYPSPSYNTVDPESLGSVIVDSSSGSVAGRFGAIQVLNDCTISSVASTTIDDVAKLQTSFIAGTVLYGVFTELTLTGGLVALHNV
jgi:hypothetical protein